MRLQLQALWIMARVSGINKHLHMHLEKEQQLTPACVFDNKLILQYVPNGYEDRPDTSHLLKDCSEDNLTTDDEQDGATA